MRNRLLKASHTSNSRTGAGAPAAPSLQRDLGVQLAVAKLRTDGGTQPRVRMDQAVVNEYCDQMKRGAVFPPVVAYFDGTKYWLADGFHRLAAAKLAGLAQISVDVRQGTVGDALIFALGANATHGLPRSAADKRRVVILALQYPELRAFSNYQIAEICGVSYEFVRKMRGRTEPSGPPASASRTVMAVRGGLVYPMNVAGIGGRWSSVDGARPAPPANANALPSARPVSFPSLARLLDRVSAHNGGVTADTVLNWGVEPGLLSLALQQGYLAFREGSGNLVWLASQPGLEANRSGKSVSDEPNSSDEFFASTDIEIRVLLFPQRAKWLGRDIWVSARPRSTSLEADDSVSHSIWLRGIGNGDISEYLQNAVAETLEGFKDKLREEQSGPRTSRAALSSGGASGSGPTNVRGQESDRATAFSVLLAQSVHERVRDAVFYTPGLTVAELVKGAVIREVERLERQRGGKFPARKGEIRTGRPVKAANDTDR